MHIFRDLIERFERFQGGFVWDWQDKCLVGKTTSGEEFNAYGGDFGEEVVERTFPKHMVANGIVFSNLKPKPVAYEVKNVQAPIQVVAVVAEAGRFKILNRHLCWDSNRYTFSCEVLEEGITLAQRALEIPVVKPMAEDLFEVDLKALLPVPKPGVEYFVNFRIQLAERTPWADAGHEIFCTQFPLSGVAARQQSSTVQGFTGAKLSSSESEFRISSGNLTVIFDRRTGLFSANTDKGTLIANGATENVMRPESGLDFHEEDQPGTIYHLWAPLQPENLTRQLRDIQAFARPDGSVQVEVAALLISSKSSFTIESETSYLITGDGQIRIDTQLDIGRGFKHVPRAGITLILPEGFEALEWYGRGPGESYCDRKDSTAVGIFHSTIAAQHIPFVPPSECGGHEETRWLKLSHADGRELLVKSPGLFHFDAHHSSVADYYNAPHDHELLRRPETFLNLDAHHVGIGGNMAWCTVIDDRHLVPANCYRFRYELTLS